mmetsp:Transcript_3426/g.10822  ORF Transcript_3426/g.10822 Transcript_3426/m.10822 type:complete len:221 (+) Transcript_3426:307-969(+)
MRFVISRVRRSALISSEPSACSKMFCGCSSACGSAGDSAPKGGVSRRRTTDASTRLRCGDECSGSMDSEAFSSSSAATMLPLLPLLPLPLRSGSPLLCMLVTSGSSSGSCIMDADRTSWRASADGVRRSVRPTGAAPACGNPGLRRWAPVCRTRRVRCSGEVSAAAAGDGWPEEAVEEPPSPLSDHIDTMLSPATLLSPPPTLPVQASPLRTWCPWLWPC